MKIGINSDNLLGNNLLKKIRSDFRKQKESCELLPEKSSNTWSIESRELQTDNNLCDTSSQKSSQNITNKYKNLVQQALNSGNTQQAEDLVKNYVIEMLELYNEYSNPQCLNLAKMKEVLMLLERNLNPNNPSAFYNIDGYVGNSEDNGAISIFLSFKGDKETMPSQPQITFKTFDPSIDHFNAENIFKGLAEDYPLKKETEIQP